MLALTFVLPVTKARYKIAGTCDATSIATGETPGRTLSQRLITRVEPGSTFATACMRHAMQHACDATCIVTMETQVTRWALAHHACFRLVALDSRHDTSSRNQRSLSHVTAFFEV